jgi:DNA repair protein RadD
MYKLRDYQTEAVYSIFRYFDKYKSASGDPVVVLPTGTGKSLVIAEFFRLLLEWYPGQKAMLLTHVKELIAQNHEKMMNLWPEAPAGIYSSGLKKKNTNHQIIFAGIQSVAKKAQLFGKVDIVMVDECHMISPKEATSYNLFFKELKKVNPYLKVIGLTATPYRLGFGPITRMEGDLEEGIDAMFDHIVFDGSSVAFFNWFISEGYLLPVVPKRTSFQLDVNGVKKRGGEFVAAELQTAVNKREANEAALNEALEVGADRKSWLVFCAGVEHAIDVANMLNEKGISAAAVHSKTTDAERDRIIADFKAGRIRAVTNNNVLTTGFDYPGIDMIIMLRPTQSTVLWVQMLGRGTRPDYAPGYDISVREQRLEAIQASTKHDCLVLDFSGNSRRLGPINDPAVPRRPGRKGSGPGIYKECEVCGTDGQYPAWRFCGGVDPAEGKVPHGFCGAAFKFKEKLKVASSSEKLIKESLEDKTLVKDFTVENVIYQKNINRNDPTKPPTLKVTYHCGHTTISEFVCLMHSDWAGRKAYTWWKNRTNLPLPATIDDALEIVASLKVPTHIKARKNGKFYEVLRSCYDGTCFGTIESVVPDIGIQVYTKDNIMSSSSTETYQNVYDQDNHEEVSAASTDGYQVLTPAANMPFDEDIPF